MNHFLMPFAGGILIGLSTSFFLLICGRVTGISSIVGALFRVQNNTERLWRVLFIAGLALGSYLLVKGTNLFAFSMIEQNRMPLFIGSILVGFGARLGSGCTSGHGICGIPRGSRRSIAATMIFMATGILTVYVLKFI